MPSAETRLSYGYYDVVRELGRGSMGTVYLARDRRIGREAALKTIEFTRNQFEDTGALEEFYLRLQREAEVSGSINHPNVVTLYEAGYDEGRISFLAMEYVDGRSLLDLLKLHRPGAIPADRAASIARDVLSGLACAHERGIIHRDIKPANILLTSSGRAKIADFGIARPKGSSITIEGTLIGTPDYMSPEQVRGEPVTPASDLFSFGSLLFEMLTGRKPFLGNDVTSTMYNIVHGPTPIVTDVEPEGLRELLETLLSKKPQYRFPSANEALVELGRVLSGSGAPDRPDIPALPVASEITARIAEAASPPAGERTELSADDRAATKQSILRRTVPPNLVTAAIAVAAAPLVIALAITLPSLDSDPTVEIPPERLAEFREKAEMMARADSLCAEGSFEECLAAYDAYLERYPTAPAAIEGRTLALEALQNERENKPQPARPSRWTSLKNRVKGLFDK